MKFEEFELKKELLENINKLNISECTEIQNKAIPLVLDCKDISGLSQTGSGKTFAFLVPLIDRILCSKNQNSESATELDKKRAYPSWNAGHFALILAPTRELADQIHKNVLLLTANTGLKSVLVYGGVDYELQTNSLQSGVDIVVGTPGRLIDLYKSHHINFKNIHAVVFDEADRMFDMGFKDDMVYILQRAPKDRQILLFSATLNFDVLNTIYRFGANPVEINISKDQVKAGEVVDEIFHVGEPEKPQFLLSVIGREKPKQTIIFSNYKNNVERIASFLNANGVPTVGISSLLTQNQRERVLQQFKNENERNTLVATDVAARGLDIKGVDLVINYDLPDDAENYVHRIGRTGRAGEKGKAFSLVSDRDVMALSRIEGYLKHKVTIGWIDDAHLVKEFKPMPADTYRSESRVQKTGMAAVKAAIPSHGNRDRDQRRDRHENRGFKNPRHRDQDSYRSNSNRNEDSNRSYGSRQPHESAGPGQVHRDRKLGRHQSFGSKNGSEQSQQRPHKQTHSKYNDQNKNKSFKKQKFDKKKNFRANKPIAGSNKPKLSQRIKGFLKSLFR